jgi:hypothetical protein
MLCARKHALLFFWWFRYIGETLICMFLFGRWIAFKSFAYELLSDFYFCSWNITFMFWVKEIKWFTYCYSSDLINGRHSSLFPEHLSASMVINFCSSNSCFCVFVYIRIFQWIWIMDRFSRFLLLIGCNFQIKWTFNLRSHKWNFSHAHSQ